MEPLIESLRSIMVKRKMIQRTPTNTLLIAPFYEVTKRISLGNWYRQQRQALGADVRAILQLEEAEPRPPAFSVNLPFFGPVTIDYSTRPLPRITRGRIGAITNPVPVPGDTPELSDSDTFLRAITVKSARYV